ADSVEKIIAYRMADNTDKDGAGLQALLGSQFASLAQYITTTDSGVYSIEAAGYQDGNEKVRYGLKAIVSILQNNKHEIFYYQSPARVRHAI
ncbi:MAG TPA: hypothetical protein VKO67_04805, partial [Smithellaceae bacterium]|nr:hypothetical protein [Smithellaceae bacterium]